MKSDFEIIVPKEEKIDFEQFVAIEQNLSTSELKIIVSSQKIVLMITIAAIQMIHKSKMRKNEAVHCLDKLKIST